MARTLILADNPFWFGQAIRIKKEHGYDGPHDIDIGVSYKLSRSERASEIQMMGEIVDAMWHHFNVGVDSYRCDGSLTDRKYDTVLSLHCIEIFRPELTQYKGTNCYNLHPGLLPHGRGWNPVTWARLTGEPAGATLHLMSPRIDGGPIVDQIKVEVDFADTCYAVWLRVQNAEMELLRRYEARIVSNNMCEEPVKRQEGNWPTRTRKDFSDLCEIPLGETMQVRELINRLAALTYGERKTHAYVTDARGRKIKVGVFMEAVDED